MKNAIQIGKSEMQKFQTKVSRYNTDKRIKHDDKIDKALVIAYRNGDGDAGWELFTSYIDEIAICYRYPTQAPRNSEGTKKLEYDTLTPYEKEDLLQEIALQFVKLMLEWGMVKPFENFVRSTLRQRVFNQFFSKELDIKFNEKELNEEETLPQEDLDLESRDTPDKHLDLYQALNQLTSSQREILEYTVVKGWNVTEVAVELGLNKKAVESKKKRALDKLKQIMIK